MLLQFNAEAWICFCVHVIHTMMANFNSWELRNISKTTMTGDFVKRVSFWQEHTLIPTWNRLRQRPSITHILTQRLHARSATDFHLKLLERISSHLLVIYQAVCETDKAVCETDNSNGDTQCTDNAHVRKEIVKWFTMMDKAIKTIESLFPSDRDITDAVKQLKTVVHKSREKIDKSDTHLHQCEGNNKHPFFSSEVLLVHTNSIVYMKYTEEEASSLDDTVGLTKWFEISGEMIERCVMNQKTYELSRLSSISTDDDNLPSLGPIIPPYKAWRDTLNPGAPSEAPSVQSLMECVIQTVNAYIQDELNINSLHDAIETLAFDVFGEHMQFMWEITRESKGQLMNQEKQRRWYHLHKRNQSNKKKYEAIRHTKLFFNDQFLLGKKSYHQQFTNPQLKKKHEFARFLHQPE